MCCQAPAFYNRSGGLYNLNKAKVASYVARFDHYVNSASAQLIVTVHYGDGKTRDELIIAQYPDSTVALTATPQVSSACMGCD